MYHYTYLLINKKDVMFYVGKRSSKVPPLQDSKYKSSSKYVPKEKCIKLILKEFKTSEEALRHEILLHEKLNIASNPSYYNRSKQTSTGFDTTGVSFTRDSSVGKNISEAKKGKVPKWSVEGKKIILNNLKNAHTEEAKAKRLKTLALNPNVRGISSCKFSPWYISTSTITYLFVDITKKELSVKEGHYKKFYADLQKKFNKKSKDGEKLNTRKYGTIISMGNLPKQYKI